MLATEESASCANCDIHNQWSKFLTEDVYRNLMHVARSVIKSDKSVLREEAEDLLHQTFLRFIRNPPQVAFTDQTHFCSYMAKAIKHCLIDLIRSSMALKRGCRVTELITERELACLDDSMVGQIAVGELLAQLHRRTGKRSALILEMHALKRASLQEIASELSLSVRTVKRDLATVRKWAASELELRGKVA